MIERLRRFWNSVSWTEFVVAALVLVLAVSAAVVFRVQLIDWLVRFWQSLTWQRVLLGVVVFLVSLTISFVALGIVMVKIPPHYFSSHHERDFLPDSPWLVRWGAVIAKNILGVFLICLGILLSLPGVPGQGVLTILLGLIMVDIPGKRPLEARIIQRPTVLAAINKLRAKYEKPPLVLD
ncbi:MAG: hypothetical protein KA956_13870 [Pyrinomonadaceae bacterium]|nr:hypothetical protein [Acidobacteriota bacterium]MBP7377558.1 hypothetical protein [Pyrinomonadaceae bacterium]